MHADEIFDSPLGLTFIRLYPKLSAFNSGASFPFIQKKRPALSAGLGAVNTKE
jgi:hypothetical protein